MIDRKASNAPASSNGSGFKVAALVFALATIAIAADVVWMMPATTPIIPLGTSTPVWSTPDTVSEQAGAAALRFAQSPENSPTTAASQAEQRSRTY